VKETEVKSDTTDNAQPKIAELLPIIADTSPLFSLRGPCGLGFRFNPLCGLNEVTSHSVCTLPKHHVDWFDLSIRHCINATGLARPLADVLVLEDPSHLKYGGVHLANACGVRLKQFSATSRLVVKPNLGPCSDSRIAPFSFDAIRIWIDLFTSYYRSFRLQPLY
jgi:hypothetical protein